MFEYIGKSYPVHDAEEKARGRLQYVADMKLPNMLYGKMLFSSHAHARILRIDASAAEALPGVHCVATCFNSPDVVYNSAKRFIGHDMHPDEQIFPHTVRYYGDRVAAVAADTEAIASKAISLIRVEYEDLPLILDVEKAVESGAYPIHEDGNLVGTFHAATGDTDKALAEADYVVSGRYTVPIVHHFAMEPHGCIAYWERDNLRVLDSTQNVFAARLILSEVFQMPMNRIRVEQTPVGGAFGSKYEIVLEPVAAQLSKMCGGRPVMLVLNRANTISSTKTRHAVVMYIKGGVKKDGTVTALKFLDYINAGAYAGSTMNIAACIGSKSMMLYHVPNMDFTGYGIYTNTPVAAGMRGYGSPQAVFSIELLFDKIARTIGMDPAELRLKNLAVPGDIQPCNGASLGNVRVKECLSAVTKLADWEHHKDVEIDGDIRRAHGFCVGVHGNGVYPKLTDITTIGLRLMGDGSVTMYTASQDMGQGLIRVEMLIAAEVLRMPQEDIAVVNANTDYTDLDLGTAASRGTWVGGRATQLACEKFRDEIIAEASGMLAVPPYACELVDSVVYVALDHSRFVTLCDVAVHIQQVSCKGELSVTIPYYSVAGPGTYAADYAEVAVNVKTGEAKVEKFYAVHDAGRVINPMQLEGQIEGGIQMGLGYALCEEMKFDPQTGRITNCNARKYKIFKASEMPKIVVRYIEDGIQEHGPFGAKSCSEITVVPVAPAIINAINRAIGAEVCDLPATPERILAAIEKRQKQKNSGEAE